MVPGPRAAADIVIESFALERPPIDAVLLIREIGEGELWFEGLSDAEVTDKCDEWAGRFHAFLKREYNGRVGDGRFVRYEFNSSTETYIQGSCFPEPTDSDDLKEAKRLRSNHGGYSELLGTISPRSFEAVCTGILGLLGCEKPRLTRRSGDQGVDFFGELKLEGKLGAPFAWPSVDKNFKTWLIGQAKQYAEKVSTGELRELAGSIQLARAKVSSDDGSALASLNIRLFDPIFYLFLTSGKLSADSRKLAERAGIITLDGGDMAALLADRGVGMKEGAFDPAAVLQWIAGYESET